MNKLIKINESHYVICDDSEIKEGDYYFHTLSKKVESAIHCYGRKTHPYPKVTHSTQPLEKSYNSQKQGFNMGVMSSDIELVFDKINLISLSEVEEAIYGYNVEKMAVKYCENHYGKKDWEENYHNYAAGFKAHQELVKDKLFTLSFIIDLVPKVLEKQKELSDSDFNDWYNSDFLRMLFPKKEWDIIFDEQNKIKLI